MHSDEFLKIAARQVSESCVIQLGETPASLPLASVMVLIDGPVLTSLLLGASESHAKLVLSTKRMRLPAFGWLERTQTLSHAVVGGVTDKSQQLVVHYPAASPLISFEPRVVENPGWDASTVLMVNEYCHLLQAIPDPLEVFPLPCVNLRSEDWPVYHGAGLCRRPRIEGLGS